MPLSTFVLLHYSTKFQADLFTFWEILNRLGLLCKCRWYSGSLHSWLLKICPCNWLNTITCTVWQNIWTISVSFFIWFLVSQKAVIKLQFIGNLSNKLVNEVMVRPDYTMLLDVLLKNQIKCGANLIIKIKILINTIIYKNI